MAQALAEKLEHTGPAEKQRVASVPQREREREREQLASTPKPPLPRGTELFVQSTKSWEGRESRWAREKGIRARASRGKGGFHGEVEGSMSG